MIDSVHPSLQLVQILHRNARDGKVEVLSAHGSQLQFIGAEEYDTRCKALQFIQHHKPYYSYSIPPLTAAWAVAIIS